MPYPRQVIEQAIAAGTLQQEQLLPAVPDETRSRLAESLPGSLPQYIDELWRLCSGLIVGSEKVEFTGNTGGFGKPVESMSGKYEREGALESYEASSSNDNPFSVFTRCSVILTNDGCGNHWENEIAPDGTWGPVWFMCHDAPVSTIAATDLASFLAVGLGKKASRWGKDTWPCGDDHDIWSRNPFAQNSAELANSTDPMLRDYARSIGPEFDVFDLREGRSGTGIPWGRYGAPEDFSRHPTARLFSAKRPPPRKSLWQSLFG